MTTSYNKTITIYTITYNEQLLVPFFVEFYRQRFPNCRIIIHDNESTDDTVKLAKELGCEFIFILLMFYFVILR